MINYQTIDGKKTAVVNIIVDPQKGFHDFLLQMISGGNLYVPGGEEVITPIGKLISNTQNGIFIISNDWHTKDNIADMNSHTGVVAFRKAALAAQQKNPEEYQSPLAMPFSELVLDKDGYIIGLKGEDDRIRKVTLQTTDGQPPSPEDRGRVVEVLDEYLPEKLSEIVGARTQYLWSSHCVQGTESARMHDGLNLPKGLVRKLDNDITQLLVSYNDATTGNKFYVVRKGTRSEVDSNGLYVENDKTTLTPAQLAFQELAAQFIKDDVANVVINYMGLATNFCVEFSCNQVAAIGAGFFTVAGMQVNHNLVVEACRGIPIPGGKDDAFSLDGTLPRLAEKFGFREATIDNIIAFQQGRPDVDITGSLAATGAAKSRSAAA